jgi:hypothetical protein
VGTAARGKLYVWNSSSGRPVATGPGIQLPESSRFSWISHAAIERVHHPDDLLPDGGCEIGGQVAGIHGCSEVLLIEGGQCSLERTRAAGEKHAEIRSSPGSAIHGCHEREAKCLSKVFGRKTGVGEKLKLA